MSSVSENASVGKDKKVYVLDASAFMIGGIEPREGVLYTTESVVSEVRGSIIQKSRVEGLVASRMLNLCSPQKRYIELVVQRSTELGELRSLSETDIEILALALELKDQGLDVTIISDDYSIQNIAASFKIKWSGIKYLGISQLIQWKMVCEMCKYETYDIKDIFCPKCGLKMKRKPWRN